VALLREESLNAEQIRDAAGLADRPSTESPVAAAR
jgi:hypothetical protein